MLKTLQISLFDPQNHMIGAFWFCYSPKTAFCSYLVMLLPWSLSPKFWEKPHTHTISHFPHKNFMAGIFGLKYGTKLHFYLFGHVRTFNFDLQTCKFGDFAVLQSVYLATLSSNTLNLGQVITLKMNIYSYLSPPWPWPWMIRSWILFCSWTYHFWQSLLILWPDSSFKI